MDLKSNIQHSSVIYRKSKTDKLIFIKYFDRILFFFLAVMTVLIIGIVLLDRYVTQSFFSEQIMHILIESKIFFKFISSVYGLLSHPAAGLFSFIIACTVLGGIKLILKKTMSKRTAAVSILVILTNCFIICLTVVLYIHIILINYMNTVFDTALPEIGAGCRYAEKVDLLDLHLQNTNIAAEIVLAKMIYDVEHGIIDIDALSCEEYITLGKEAGYLVHLKGSVDSKKEHYFRNYFSRAPASLEQMIATIQYDDTDPFKWKLMSSRDTALHMFGPDGEYNLKFVSGNGLFEAVYNKQGELLTAQNTPINMGTFNFASPISEPKQHMIYDILPYIWWNNTPDSPAPDVAQWEVLGDKYENNIEAQNRYNMYKNLLTK